MQMQHEHHTVSFTNRLIYVIRPSRAVPPLSLASCCPSLPQLPDRRTSGQGKARAWRTLPALAAKSKAAARQGPAINMRGRLPSPSPVREGRGEGRCSALPTTSARTALRRVQRTPQLLTPALSRREREQVSAGAAPARPPHPATGPARPKRPVTAAASRPPRRAPPQAARSRRPPCRRPRPNWRPARRPR